MAKTDTYTIATSEKDWVQQVVDAQATADRHEMEICFAIADSALRYQLFPRGTLRANMKGKCRTTLPQAGQQCNGMRLNERQKTKFFGCASSKQSKEDRRMLEQRGVDGMDIANRVAFLVGEMQTLLRRGKGHRHDVRAANIVRMAKGPDMCGWTGSNFVQKLPETNSQWCMWLQEEATLETPWHYRVSQVTWGGAEECPFQDENDPVYYGYEYGSRDIVIQDLLSGETVALSTLSVHMMQAHNFFQQSLYRLDPAQLLRVLFRMHQPQ